MVRGDPVAFGRARIVAPGPSHRHAAVGEVGDLATLDGGPVGHADPDSDPRRMEAAAVGDRTVADRVFGDPGDRTPPRRRRPDHHATGAEIEQLAAIDETAATADAERQAVAANMADPAANQLHVPRAGERHRGADVEIPLGRCLAARGHRPVAVRERQPDETEMIDRAPRNRLPADRQERVDPRRHDLGRVRILTIEGAVGERAGRYVEIPRSRAPERFAHILEPVSCAGGNGPPGIDARGRANELDVRRAGLFSRLDRRDPQPRHRPLMHGHNFDRVALTPLPQDILCGSREPVVPPPCGVG